MASPSMNLLDNSPSRDVTAITGPTLAGTMLNWYLYGILTVQYILYMLYSRNDKISMKVIVHLIFALDSVQTFLTMDDAFFWFVYNFGDFAKVYQFHWAFDIPTLDAIIAFLVQLVYCWRIWVLSGWKIIPVLSALISLIAAGSGFASGVRFQLQKVPESGRTSEVPIILWLIGSAVVDVVLAGSMTYILLRVRKDSPTAQKTTGGKIMRILTLTLETNAITAAVAIETVIIFFIKPIAPPTTNFYQLGGYMLGKLYSNCFMILLNQRHHSSRPKIRLGVLSRGTRSETISGFSVELGSPRTGARIGIQPSTSGHQVLGSPATPKVKGLPNERVLPNTPLSDKEFNELRHDSTDSSL